MDGAEGIGWFFGWLIVSLAMFSLFYIIISIIFWIIEGIIINKLHKEMNGKATALAWVPFCNIYLLGKLTVNKPVGWALAISKILTYTITTTVNGVQKTYSILPSSISTLLSGIVGIITFCLLIYAIVKYKRLKNSNAMQNPASIIQQPYQQQQPMNGQPTYQQPQPMTNGQPTYQQPQPMTNGQPTYQQTVPQQQVPQQTMVMPQQPQIQQQPINSFCTNCGAKFNGNEAFCTNCGTPRQ